MATLKVQLSGDKMDCCSKALANEYWLIATPIGHDEQTKKFYTSSGVAWVTKARNCNWIAEDCRRKISSIQFIFFICIATET